MNFSRFYSRDLELFTKAVQIQLLVAQESCKVFSDINEQLSILRECMSADISESDKATAEIIRILKLFTRLCHLDDEDEPHGQNQKILYNSGKLHGHLTCICIQFTLILSLTYTCLNTSWLTLSWHDAYVLLHSSL
jgi:hypothetical protein